MNIKKGNPIIAVTIPTGISTEDILRAIKSTTCMNAAPSRKEFIMTYKLLDPPINLTICGINNPTQPIGPQTAVTELVNSVVIPISIPLNFFILIPRI